MPKLPTNSIVRQHADAVSALDNFQKEMKAKRVWHGLELLNDFADAIGSCNTTASKYQDTPTVIRMDAMQRIVKVLKPDIGIMLRFLGYSDKEIKKYAADLTQPDTKAAVADFAKEFAKQLGGVMNDVNI